MNEPVILIDVMNLVFRMHFAHQKLSADGNPTGVQYGVIKTIADLRTHVSKRCIFCWDHGVPVLGAPRSRNWREEVLPSYKANRKHDKNDDNYKNIVSQLPDLHKVISCLGYSHVSVMGLEADDIIGVLSNSFKEVLIFSTDKDFYQLISDRVKVLVPKKEKTGFRTITEVDVEKEYGISVSRWAEYLALGGDSADNIKPMRGMGPKTAIKLLQSEPHLNLEHDHGYELVPIKYKTVWSEIQKSYYAARIPREWKDPRIKPCLDAAGYTPYTFASIATGQTWPNEFIKAGDQYYFESFLANRNMNSLLSIRHTFFQTEREQPVCSQIVSPKQKRTALV